MKPSLIGVSSYGELVGPPDAAVDVDGPACCALWDAEVQRGRVGQRIMGRRHRCGHGRRERVDVADLDLGRQAVAARLALYAGVALGTSLAALALGAALAGLARVALGALRRDAGVHAVDAPRPMIGDPGDRYADGGPAGEDDHVALRCLDRSECQLLLHALVEHEGDDVPRPGVRLAGPLGQAVVDQVARGGRVRHVVPRLERLVAEVHSRAVGARWNGNVVRVDDLSALDVVDVQVALLALLPDVVRPCYAEPRVAHVACAPLALVGGRVDELQMPGTVSIVDPHYLDSVALGAPADCRQQRQLVVGVAGDVVGIVVEVAVVVRVKVPLAVPVYVLVWDSHILCSFS